MFKNLFVTLAIVALSLPSAVFAQGGQPVAPNTEPLAVIAQQGGNVNVKNIAPPSVVKVVQGSQSPQPIAQNNSSINPVAVIGNTNVTNQNVVNKTDVAINTTSMTKVGVVKYDVSSQLPKAGKNEASVNPSLNQGAKSYVPSNYDIAVTKTVVTPQNVGEVTFDVFQTSDGKIAIVPDAHSQQILIACNCNPTGAKADYSFLNGSAAIAANGGALKDFGVTSEQVQQASGGDPSTVTQYLQRTYTNANANQVKNQAQIESQTPLQSLAVGTGPLAAAAKTYYETFFKEFNNPNLNYSTALNLLYAAQSAATAADTAQKFYVDIQYQKALDDTTTGKNYAVNNTVVGIGADGSYMTMDIEPILWSGLYAEIEKGALAQGNDPKHVGMMFIFDKCQPTISSCPITTTIKTPTPGTTGTDPFAPTAGGGGAGDLEPILTGAGYGVNPLGICAARDWTIGQDNPSAPPYMNSGKTGPNNPVVINQDPTKRGSDISVNVIIPPVIVGYNGTYTERVNERPDPIPGNPGRTTWDRLIEECRRYTITIPDRVANMNVTLDLSAESVKWITNDLALRYPGLRVYQGHWDVFPGLCAGGTLNDFREFGCFAKGIPLKDPGQYILAINGMTTGTVVTAPRPISYTDRFGVSALMVALIK